MPNKDIAILCFVIAKLYDIGYRDSITMELY